MKIKITSIPNQFSDGGNLGLGHTNGAVFSNGVAFINNGGLHSENPFDGVPMGVDQEGIPNLVEEGEVIYNDYVYSNRLKVPKSVKEKYKLKGADGMTFAEAAKKVQKESEERPNDPISKRSLDDIMSKLMMEQEDIRMKREARRLSREFGLGGLLYADGGGIYIAPSKRGTFTAAAKKRGMGVQEFANKVLSNKEDYSPAMVKKANFAKNASKWKHAYGGFKGNRYDIGGVKLTPYSYSNDWSDFQWRTDDGYDKGYLNFANNINQDWVNRILSGAYGDMSRYNKDNKGKAITPTQVGALATDGKYSDMHKAMGAAYMDYLRGMNPATGEVPINQSSGSISHYLLTPKEEPINVPDYDWWGGIPGLEDIREGAKKYGPVSRSILTGDTDPEKPKTPSGGPTWLRYAPVVGAGIGLAQGLLSKPDYSNADMVLEAARNVGNYRQVDFNPIGNYLRYTPFDRLFYTNKLEAQAGATRRNIMNTSGGNRGAAMAGLLSADYNAQTNLGELFRKAEEYNLGQRERVATFNRDTNKFNSEGRLKADIANQEAAMKAGSTSLSGIAQAAGMREAIDQARNNNISANFSNLFTSLGNIGEDAINRRERDMLIWSGVYGMPSFKPYGWSDDEWNRFKEHAKKNGIKAQGGKVNRRKKGLTI